MTKSTVHAQKESGYWYIDDDYGFSKADNQLIGGVPEIIDHLVGINFAMLVIHTSPKDAKTEIPSLRTAMSEVAALYFEPDVICIGNFNADGSYYNEGAGTDLDGFSGYLTVIPNSADTTVATSSNTYDRIQLTQSLASDYANLWGVLRFTETYDVSDCEGTATTAGTELALSDHYPVWAEFYVDRDEE